MREVSHQKARRHWLCAFIHLATALAAERPAGVRGNSVLHCTARQREAQKERMIFGGEMAGNGAR